MQSNLLQIGVYSDGSWLLNRHVPQAFINERGKDGDKKSEERNVILYYKIKTC